MKDPQKYEEIISESALAAGALGVPGSFFPPADIAGMSAIWFQMFIRIADESGHEVDGAFVAKFVTSITTSAALYLGGSKLANALLHLIPFAGNTTAAVTNAAFNYIYTERLGRFLVGQFNQPDIDIASLIRAATVAAAMIFALPTHEEAAMAQDSIDGDSIDINNHEIHHSSTPNWEYTPSAHEVTSPSSEIPFGGLDRSYEHLARFSGLHGVEQTADTQVGPTCGPTSLEDLIKIYNPGAVVQIDDNHIGYGIHGHHFAENIQHNYAHGWQGLVDPDDYPEILSNYNIGSTWIAFDHGRVIEALNSNRPILVTGDAHYLNPYSYPPNSPHAFLLTDAHWDTNGNLVYFGIDPNDDHKVACWRPEQVQMACNGYKGKMLVPDEPPVHWPFHD